MSIHRFVVEVHVDDAAHAAHRSDVDDVVDYAAVTVVDYAAGEPSNPVGEEV